MRYRPRWSVLSLGAVIVILLFTFPAWRKVFTGRAGQGVFPAASEAQRQVLADMNKTDRSVAATAYVAMLTVVPAPTDEQATPVLPSAQVLRTGDFSDLDALRTASGKITLYRSADQSLLLRFDDFQVTNAPQLTVYLSASPQPQVSADLDGAGFSRFPVGALKGSKGNQQFTIPKELNLSRYKSVVIYSDALQLIYAYATFQ